MAVKECCCVRLLNKKSIFAFRLSSQIFYLLLFVSLMPIASTAETAISCSNVKTIFERKGMLSAIDIQEQPNSDAGGLCVNTGCCGAAARTKLTQQARTQLESALRSELGKLADTLSSRAKKFDEFFRKLLQLSREELHAMFKRTYGMIYEQHSYVFEELFQQLERYYVRSDTNFEHMMDGFFGILYQKMFTVLNSQYSFDEKYLKCVNDHMREIQPFEDVPQKLSVQLRRAFVATRTFHKALKAGADVVRNMMQVGVTPECVTAWARLRFCGWCAAQEAPACSRYCHNVIRGCLPTHADLGEQWDAYVDAVENVADRLLGPFNIAMVVKPIDIKISEAIMSFQEHNQDISQKIFADCGKPVLGGAGGSGPFFPPERNRRFVRSAPDSDFDWMPKGNDIGDFEFELTYDNSFKDDMSFRTPEEIKRTTEEMAEQAKLRDKFLQYMRGKIDLKDYEEHERKRREAQPQPEPEPAPAGTEIDYKRFEFEEKKGSKKKPTSGDADHKYEQLVRETRSRLRSSKHYWSKLPGLLCDVISVTTSPCFNGTHVASYTPAPAGEGKAALASNPEVRGVAGDGATAQQEVLRALTTRLKDAYNGLEVRWTDEDDMLETADSSTFTDRIDGMGSGSGSGDFTDDTEGLPDDDEDKDNEYGEGSGDNRPDDEDEPIETKPENETPIPTPITEPPFVPNIIGTPGTQNVNLRTRIADIPPETIDEVPPAKEVPEMKTVDQTKPVKEKPVPGSADRPSLNTALFTYALPVVCAWFGTIVTDLF